MTNEDKINELLELSKGQWLKLNEANIYNNPNNTKGCLDAMYTSKLLEMAQWKDEQFDKKLQEIVDYVYPRILGGERLHINEIIGKDMVWKH